MMFSFEQQPAIGTVMRIDGQEFELAAIAPHQRKDGAMSELLVWQTQCATCGAGFVVKTTFRSSGPNRRCAECTRPGKPVNGRRGRKAKVEIIEP